MVSDGVEFLDEVRVSVEPPDLQIVVVAGSRQPIEVLHAPDRRLWGSSQLHRAAASEVVVVFEDHQVAVVRETVDLSGQQRLPLRTEKCRQCPVRWFS